jgi:hypothetical protein
MRDPRNPEPKRIPDADREVDAGDEYAIICFGTIGEGSLDHVGQSARSHPEPLSVFEALLSGAEVQTSL